MTPAGKPGILHEAEASGMQDFRRMPAVFGPTGGPRNLPAAKEHLRYVSSDTILVATARSEADALAALLPPRFRLDGEPRVKLLVYLLGNLGWLAGRSHESVAVCIPAVFEGEDGEVAGNFLPVLWENLADSLLTGRDEIGFPKLWSDIHVSNRGDAYSCSATWDGFRFFEMEVEGLVETEVDDSPPPPFLVRRYVPRAFGAGAQIDEVLAVGGDLPGGKLAAPDGRSAESTVKSRRLGRATFSFHPARWEDMPTQYHVVNALSRLPLEAFEVCVETARANREDLSTAHVVR